MRPSRRSAAACMAMPRPAVLLPLLMLWAALLGGACAGASCCCSRLLLRRHGAAVTICSNMQACWLCGSRAGLHVCSDKAVLPLVAIRMFAAPAQLAHGA
jgi:hypothetical protein